jgi:hypothetical protein
MEGRDSLTYPLQSFQLMQCNTAALYANLFIRLRCKTRILDHMCGGALCFLLTFLAVFRKKLLGDGKSLKKCLKPKIKNCELILILIFKLLRKKYIYT